MALTDKLKTSNIPEQPEENKETLRRPMREALKALTLLENN